MSKTKQWYIEQTGKRWMWLYLVYPWDSVIQRFWCQLSAQTSFSSIFFQNLNLIFWRNVFLNLYLADLSLKVDGCTWLALVLVRPWCPLQPTPHTCCLWYLVSCAQIRSQQPTLPGWLHFITEARRYLQLQSSARWRGWIDTIEPCP